MKFKLDENFGARTQGLFQEAGHDVKTVRDQKLQGCNDKNIGASYNLIRNELPG